MLTSSPVASLRRMTFCVPVITSASPTCSMLCSARDGPASVRSSTMKHRAATSQAAIFPGAFLFAGVREQAERHPQSKATHTNVFFVIFLFFDSSQPTRAAHTQAAMSFAGFATPSAAGGFSLGSSAAAMGAGGFNLGSAAGGFSLGSTAASAGGFSLGSTAPSTGGFSLGSNASSSTSGFSLGGAASSAGGFSLGSTASSAGGFSLGGSVASSSASGFSGLTASSAMVSVPSSFGSAASVAAGGAPPEQSGNPREANLEGPVVQAMKNLESYVAEQKKNSHFVDRHKVMDAERMEHVIRDLHQKVRGIGSEVQTTEDVVTALWEQSRDQMRDAELCERFSEPGAMADPFYGHNQTSPITEYYLKLVQRFERDMQSYRQHIKDLERALKPTSNASSAEPQDATALQDILVYQSKSFIDLSAQLQAVHEKIRDEMDNYRKVYAAHRGPQDPDDPFKAPRETSRPVMKMDEDEDELALRVGFAPAPYAAAQAAAARQGYPPYGAATPVSGMGLGAPSPFGAAKGFGVGGFGVSVASPFGGAAASPYGMPGFGQPLLGGMKKY
eukprot:m.229722 g.229722  ORF g.229722 m.229722 type:complete len:560 (+) comp18848_c1_seq1:246-1925(+)